MPKAEAYTFPETSEARPAGVSLAVAEKAKAEALAIPTKIQTIVIQGQADLDVLNGLMVEVDARLEYFSNLYRPQIAKADALHKSLLADMKNLTGPLELARKLGRSKMADYLAEEDRKRLAIERERQMAEEKARKEAEKTSDKAHELIQKGQEAKAEAIIDKAAEKIEATLAAAPVVPEKPQADYRLTESWDIEVMNADLVPRQYCEPDEVKIRRIVKANEGRIEIPGVRIFRKRSVASKAGKY